MEPALKSAACAHRKGKLNPMLYMDSRHIWTVYMDKNSRLKSRDAITQVIIGQKESFESLCCLALQCKRVVLASFNCCAFKGTKLAFKHGFWLVSKQLI